jgi:hypothetical protein
MRNLQTMKTEEIRRAGVDVDADSIAFALAVLGDLT